MESDKNLELYNITIFVAIGLFVFFTGYSFLFAFIKLDSDPLRELNRILSLVGTLLIAFSMIISGITYFTNFADKTLLVRKHLGIVGFWFILIHGVFSLFLLPNFFPFPDYYFASKNIISFLCALTSTILLIIMAFITNTWAMKKIGPKIWRLMLRYFGYTALILSLYHFGVKGWPYWTTWIQNLFSSPSAPNPALIVFGIGIVTIVLRFVLLFAITIKKIYK